MIAGLILAAGAARRFGSDKRQALTGAGDTLLDTAVQRYAEVFTHLAVVIKPGDVFGLQVCQRFGVQAVINSADDGLGSSVACGMRWALAQPLAGVVIGLADMPFVQAATLAQLAAHLEAKGQLILPTYEGQPGHPRGIPRTHFEALSTLSGERGAGAVLDWREAYTLATDDIGITQDIDTPAMLAKLTA